MNLLLLHGAIGSAEQLMPLANKLKNTFTIYTFDFAGHGASKNNPPVFSIELFAQEVVDWLDASQIDSIHVFGYSMGGYVALYLAAHYPSRIKSVFTLATKFNWTPETASEQGKLLNAEKIIEKIPAFADTLKARHKLVDWKLVLRKTIYLMASLGSYPRLQKQQLNMITCPVMLMVGDKDKMVSVFETELAANDIKNGAFMVCLNTSHPIEEVDIDELSFQLNNFFG